MLDAACIGVERIDIGDAARAVNDAVGENRLLLAVAETRHILERDA
ncbi:MAG: hypothetical protein WA441_07870 [Methyloceanibacter sp.]|jgi:hypothetical protein